MRNSTIASSLMSVLGHFLPDRIQENERKYMGHTSLNKENFKRPPTRLQTLRCLCERERERERELVDIKLLCFLCFRVGERERPKISMDLAFIYWYFLAIFIRENL